MSAAEIDRIEADLARTRERIDITLEMLQTRMAPGQLFESAIAPLRENGAEFGRNLGARVRDNPLPITLVSIGLAWLMASGQRRQRWTGSDEYGYEQGGSGAGGLKEKAQRVTESLRHASAEAAESVREYVHDAGDRARETMGRHGSGRSSYGSERSSTPAYGTPAYTPDDIYGEAAAYPVRRRKGQERGAFDFVRSQPLLAGGLALALGAAVAAALILGRSDDEDYEDYGYDPYADPYDDPDELMAEPGEAFAPADPLADRPTSYGVGASPLAAGSGSLAGGSDRLGSGSDRLGSGSDRLGSGSDRLGSGDDRLGSSGDDALGTGSDRLGSGDDTLGTGREERLGTSDGILGAGSKGADDEDRPSSDIQPRPI